MVNSTPIWRTVRTKKTRRRYTAEFKAAAVARLDETDETLSSVAQALGVAVTPLKTWRLEQQAAGSAEAMARRKAEAAELQQRRRDNKRLQEENEILRKASACFARGAEKAGKRNAPSSPPTAPPLRSACCALFWGWRAAGSMTGGPAIRSGPARTATEADLVGQIPGIFQDSGERDGAARVDAELQAHSVRIARKRVARLLKENRIRPVRRQKRSPVTTDSRHGSGIAPNLLQRAFEADRANPIWLADMTYVAPDEGWLPLAAVKDRAATRAIVGWSMADPLKRSWCETALRMAIQHRAPPRGLIHPSDRGVPYVCGAYRTILDRHGIKASLSRTGDGSENAPMESFFSSLKTELVHGTRFRTRGEAKAALFEYIEIFYNRRRRHSGIGSRTPAQAHAEMLVNAAA